MYQNKKRINVVLLVFLFKHEHQTNGHNLFSLTSYNSKFQVRIHGFRQIWEIHHLLIKTLNCRIDVSFIWLLLLRCLTMVSHLDVVKPKFHYADFHWNFPVGKVTNTYHESRRHKRWEIMKSWSFGESCRHKSWKSWTQNISTCQDVCNKVHNKSVTNLLQCMGKFGDKVCGLRRGHKSRKSMTQIMKVGDMICVADLSHMDFVAKSA